MSSRDDAVTKPVSVRKYGDYPGIHYGAHAIKVELPWITVWFSYNTPIAFQASRFEYMVARKNDWGPTTGKHIRWAKDGSGDIVTLPGEDFEKALAEAMIPRHPDKLVKVIQSTEVVEKWKTKPCENCAERKRRIDMQETRGQSLVL